MCDTRVRWFLSASWIVLVLTFLGRNDVFSRHVTVLIAAILILPLILLASPAFERGLARRRPQLARATFDVQADARDLMRMDSDKG